MFGYIKADKPEMKIKEFEIYKAVYCSLCKELGKSYGLLARLTLSYDFTFLAVLMLSLVDSDPEYAKKACVYNPFKRCTYMTGRDDIFDFVSATSLIAVYGKIIDNINDTKGLKRFGYKIARLKFSLKYDKAVKLYPFVAKAIENMVEYQAKVEKNPDAGIDLAAEPTAKGMEEVFSLCSDKDNEKRILAQLGYCIGKWIYLIDAVCDLDEDIKSGNFNPLKTSGKESAVMTMNVCSAQAGAALDLLDLKRFDGILKNIIYIGLTETALSKMSGRKDTEK